MAITGFTTCPDVFDATVIDSSPAVTGVRNRSEALWRKPTHTSTADEEEIFPATRPVALDSIAAAVKPTYGCGAIAQAVVAAVWQFR